MATQSSLPSEAPNGGRNRPIPFTATPISKILRARPGYRSDEPLRDFTISDGFVTAVGMHVPEEHSPGTLDAEGGILTQAFCHAHVHLDKCFLLQDDRFDNLDLIHGDFAEAMEATNQAKQRFEEEDLLRRGRRLIDESVAVGVLSMRAFVEVDEIVQFKCLDAGLKLKEEYREVCFVQICVFAQLALFSGLDGGEERRRLLREAITRRGVDVIGSTPYVEDDVAKSRQNVSWAIEQAISGGLFLDFHLDYNLDAAKEPLVWFVIAELQEKEWYNKARRQRVTLGHCTRLTMFTKNEWHRLRSEIGNLPVSFVGLPTSDIFMMGRPEDEESGGGQRVRGTLQIPQMIDDYGLDSAISINNIGNPFTPYGSCDPLRLANLGVGLYQAGTTHDTEVLYEAITWRAAAAIGREKTGAALYDGQPANLVLLVNTSAHAHRKQTIQSLVHTGGEHVYRIPIFQGRRIDYNGWQASND